MKRIYPPSIDAETTITKFGYDPRQLSLGSNKKVIWICKICSSKIASTMNNVSRSKSTGRCSACISIGRIVSEETRQKLSKATTASFTDERRQQISKVHKGKKLSKEHREKSIAILAKYRPIGKGKEMDIHLRNNIERTYQKHLKIEYSQKTIERKYRML